MSAAFDKLARPIQKWIRAQGWRELRDIQARATHVLMDGDADLIVAASTAGGKTEAAFLPLLSQVLDDPSELSGFDILYVAPLKALITDQARRLDDICRETELPVIPWHGDVPSSTKTRAIKRPRGVLLITPESLEALFIRRGLEIPRLFGATRAVILDELHSVLDSERGIQMRSLLARLEQALNRPIRRVGLSATLGDMGLAKAYLRPDSPEEVNDVVAAGGGAELQLQLRGYVTGDKFFNNRFNGMTREKLSTLDFAAEKNEGVSGATEMTSCVISSQTFLPGSAGKSFRSDVTPTSRPFSSTA